jgi:hypothetical protein
MTRSAFRLLSLALISFVTIGATASLHAQAPQQQLDAVERRAVESANVRVEVVLTDKADTKIVSEERLIFLLADRQLGRLRRNLPGKMPFGDRNFEVDVTPTVLGHRVRLALTVNYQTRGGSGSTGEQDETMVQFVETATSFVEPGKPTVIIEATGDPANRRVTVQATATIQK